MRSLSSSRRTLIQFPVLYEIPSNFSFLENCSRVCSWDFAWREWHLPKSQPDTMQMTGALSLSNSLLSGHQSHQFQLPWSPQIPSVFLAQWDHWTFLSCLLHSAFWELSPGRKIDNSRIHLVFLFSQSWAAFGWMSENSCALCFVQSLLFTRGV